MRRTSRSLADARGELVSIEQEFTRLHKRIEAVGDCVTDSLVRLFSEGCHGAAMICITDNHIRTSCRLIKEDFE
jgi:uncharacterized protein (UPF0218 family)